MSPTTSSTSSPTSTNSTGSGSTASSSGTTPDNDPLSNESTFLTLLVSQLQYQDPLNPVDSTEFITQLTGYSQLEQLIGIHQNTTTLASGDTTSGSGATQPSTGNTTGA